MTSLQTPTRFSFFEEKNYFCPHIAECAEFSNIAEIFWQKTFGDSPPLYYIICHSNGKWEKIEFGQN
jgi:hypothetical protein